VILDALVGSLIGIALAWFSLRRGRRARHFDIPTLAWTESPVPIWQQDRTQFALILGHGLGVAALAVMFLREGLTLAAPAPAPWAMELALGSVWIVTGAVLAFPLLYRVAGKMPMAVFTNAFVRGQFFGDWSCFSHYRADPATRVIRLHSERTPEVVRVAWQPPSEEIFNSVLGVLSAALPTRAPSGPTPWYWRPSTLLGLLAAVVGLFLLGGVLVAGKAWSWAYYPLAVLLLAAFAPTVIRLYRLD
jgi:hypothetical protein